MSSPKDEPKYLACARALALLTGVAGGATAYGATPGATAPEAPAVAAASAPDAGDASVPPVYDGGPHGSLVRNPDGCDIGGRRPISPGAAVLATVAGAGLIARRRRRRDAP